MTRDWEEYNEELEGMDDGKVGRPYEFPESYVQLAALWYKFFYLPYRQLEGALRRLGELIPELPASDYTSLWHRFKDLELEIPGEREQGHRGSGRHRSQGDGSR